MELITTATLNNFKLLDMPCSPLPLYLSQPEHTHLRAIQRGFKIRTECLVPQISPTLPTPNANTDSVWSEKILIYMMNVCLLSTVKPKYQYAK